MSRPTLVKMLAAGLLTAAFLFPAPALAQPPVTLGDLLPAGDYTAGRYSQPVPLDVLDAWRGLSVLGVAVPDYQRNLWTDSGGAPLGVTRWERAISIDFHDGGTRLDAVLVFGNTRDPGIMIATVGYAAAGWHCRGAVLVDRAALGL